MEPAVRLRHAVSLLGRFPALAGVDLSIDPGEIVLLQGPNGAGKTTLLRLCAGLLSLESGEGSVLGHDLRSDRVAIRRRVGLLGHATGLYEDLTVAENVRFWARAARIDDAGAVDAALDHLGVGGRLRDVAVGRLSAGQRRRTALATLAVRRPELWLLDEPHAALDQSGRDIVDRLVTEAAAAGATVVLASHELERVRTLQPRTITVAGGVVVNDEPARTVSPVGG
ncbi:MAG: heme ABC exporter ATP-binding protein CcmA [Acidimicrobiales bacterium]|nr:heme ABC exporter ATP-binding protein CcmA [Acidimicrobiales bacterium]